MRTALRSAPATAAVLLALLALKAPEASALCALGEAPCACAATIVKEYGKYQRQGAGEVQRYRRQGR